MKFSLKPKFVGLIAFVVQLPVIVFFSLWCAGFLNVFTSIGLKALSGGYAYRGVPFAFFVVVLFLCLSFCIYFAKKFNYARTDYKFFDDRLEFEEGFFSINKKVIRYRDIKEMTLRKGVLQRMYGLGTIYLATLATGSSSYNNVFATLGFGNISASGVGVRDIRDPDEIYEKIRALVDQHNV